MSQKSMLIFLFMALFAFHSTGAEKEQEVLSPHLAPLKPYIGKTWKGEFSSSTKEKPMVDVSRWERALNGQAVRVLHSINDGEYGGETIVVWDAKEEGIVYFYFTTAGFYTKGTMKFEDGKILSHEYVTGNEQGITEVKAITEVLPDGRFHSKSQYLKNGEWVDGHEVTYREDPKAEVIFK